MEVAKNLDENRNKRVLVYCRESRDDFMINYERIETQRDLLIKFCERSGYHNIVDIVMHNDMTGTDFSRFDEIRNMIKNNEIDVLVMKDSSRLGRNQLESLKFIELIDKYDVQLVFEGKDYDEDFFPLEAWFNERRAKDDSTKIRTNLQHKMEEGTLIVRATYGYIKKDRELVIDQEVKWVIMKIFKLYLEGYGYRAIATRLNEKKIPTPSQHRGAGRGGNQPVATAWVSQHVKRILQNEIYTGTMVSGTTEKISFKSNKTRVKPESEWIKVKGTHEAIISEEDYHLVQKLIKSKRTFAPKTKTPSPYSGLVECGRCGTSSYIVRRKDRPDAFLCGKYVKEGAYKEDLEKGCTSHRLREDHLEEIIMGHVENVLSNKDYKKHVLEKFAGMEFVKKDIESTIKALKDRLNKFKHQYKVVYDDKLNDNIPDFLFKEKSKEIEDNIHAIEGQIEKFELESKDIIEVETNAGRIEGAFRDLLKGDISKQQISKILNKIVVFDEKEITKDQKVMYNIDNAIYEEILENGGIVLVYAYNVQHAFPTRWM